MSHYDFVAIDFETANDSLTSACSMGLVAVQNSNIVKTEYFLIRPTSPCFAEKNIKIHGITPDSVKNAPLFPEVWEKVQHYFRNNVAIAHNAHFDMSVLKRCLIEHDLEIPQFYYLCSISISALVCKGQGVGNSLKERAEFFRIPMVRHHNALSDARTCANIVIMSIKQKGWEDFHSFFLKNGTIPIKKFASLIPAEEFGKPYPRYPNVSISEIAATVESFDENHYLYDKKVVFTGKLQSMDRRTAMYKVVNLGGILKSSVSRKTDIVVLGTQDKALVGPSGTSGKERKARELIENGYDIEIIGEEEFLRLIR